jgi:hypothetical protein
MGRSNRGRRVDPEPGSKHRIDPWDRGCPWTPDELERRIEEACRFIAERKRAHSRSLGWEIGEHLFFEVYGSDEAYVRRLDPTKPDSPADIARRTGIAYSTLYVWLAAAMTRHKLRQAGVEPDLDLRHFGVLDQLNDHFEALCAVAGWAGREGLSYRELERVVDFWRDRLDQGMSLEELRREIERPEPRVVRKRAKPLSPDLLKASRMLVVTGAWLGRVSLSEKFRKKLRTQLVEIRGLLVEAGS